MELNRLEVDAGTWRGSGVVDRPGAIGVLDARGLDPAVLLAACGTRPAPGGLWLRVGAGRPATLVAREVATVSRLVELRELVVAAEDGRAVAHAQIVRALLSGDEVRMENAAGRVDGARLRPAPGDRVRVWSCDDPRVIVSEAGERLVAVGTDVVEGAHVTRYAAESISSRR